MTPTDGGYESALEAADLLTPEMVEAAGTFSEGLEYVERARGHLYTFHQLIGRADKLLGDAAAQLRDAGETSFASELAEQLVGRDVLPDRWTFQIVEEFDSGYWAALRDFSRRLTTEALRGERHVAEAQMKRDGRTQ